MRDNVIWVDFSAKRKRKNPLRRLLNSFISLFKGSSNNSSNQFSKKDMIKAPKSM